MKKLTNLWKKLPRVLRSSMYILLSILTLLAIYTFLGAPTFSEERTFRRIERSHMVGPSEILGTVTLEADLGSYRQMLLADAGEGVILYCFDHCLYDPPELIYREKTGEITVLCAPYPNENREQQTTAYLPVVIFDSCPEAVRAEVEINLSVTYRNTVFDRTYRLSAPRELPGCFVVRITAHDARGIGIQGTALQRFAMLSGYHSGTYAEMEIPVTVRLYDSENTLLTETQTTVRSVSTLARENAEGNR